MDGTLSEPTEASKANKAKFHGLFLEATATEFLKPEYLTSQIRFCQALEKGDVEQSRTLLTTAKARLRFPSTATVAFTDDLSDDYGNKDVIWTPLYFAARGGHLPSVEMLLSHGVDVNLDVDLGSLDGSTPIRAAAEEGHAGVVRLLLAHNANPNIADKDGTTPLRKAATSGHVEAVGALLESKADPDAATYGSGVTPLFNAAANASLEVVRLLLKHGADPNKYKTNDGSLPLGVAAWVGNAGIVELLLLYGAIKKRDARGLKPAQYAKAGRAEHLEAWLTTAEDWSPLRVAAAGRMHRDLAFMLRNGRIDPDDRATYTVDEIIAAIAASKSEPVVSRPSGKLKELRFDTICKTTIRLVTSASFGWKHSTHWLYHANVRETVVAVLMVANRLTKKDEKEAQRRAEAAAAGGGAGDTGRGLAARFMAFVGLGGGDLPARNADEPLPRLPIEIWLSVMHYFQRSWWPTLE